MSRPMRDLIVIYTKRGFCKRNRNEIRGLFRWDQGSPGKWLLTSRFPLLRRCSSSASLSSAGRSHLFRLAPRHRISLGVAGPASRWRHAGLRVANTAFPLSTPCFLEGSQSGLPLAPDFLEGRDSPFPSGTAGFLESGQSCPLSVPGLLQGS